MSLPTGRLLARGRSRNSEPIGPCRASRSVFRRHPWVVPLTKTLLLTPLVARILLVAGLVTPFGLLIGMLFPSGIRLLHSRDEAFVPWSWGINESASVMGTLLSLFLAIKVECLMVLLAIIGVYLLAAAAAGRESHSMSRKTLKFWSIRIKAVGLLFTGGLFCGCSGPAADQTPLSYPATRKVDVVENLHGVEVADPYRWLEDLDSPETGAWVKAQNEVTFPYLKSLSDRERLKIQLTAMWNYERFGLPQKEGDLYLYTRNDGLQDQSVLYIVKGLEGEPRLLLDPNTFSEDGTISLAGTALSPDGAYLAYSISRGGSDWREWHVREVATSRDLKDKVQWVKFSSASWTGDSQGFFYSRYDEPAGDILEETNYFQKIYYHQIGDSQKQDQLVYERQDHADWGFNGLVTDDGRYLIIHVRKGTEERNRIYYKDLQSRGKVVELLNDFDAGYSFIGNQGPLFWFRTDLEAPRGRLIQIDTRRPQRDQWVELVPETRNTLRSVSALNHSFVLSYLRDAHSYVEVRDLRGRKLRELDLPAIGSASGFGGRLEDQETFYHFSSYTDPGTIYQYELESGESTIHWKPAIQLDSSAYETRQVFYSSRDGTSIPMFITFRKGLELDGKNPTLLYGYGGFNIPLTPRFSVSNAVWLKNGGVYAVANLRGGGEYGEEWHQAGMKSNKQNVFDDFISAAEWLIKEGYTSSPYIGISGGSNGGLLVGACIIQRPDLFGAALPAVGVMDMLRFHKFTIGWAWVSDYGSPDNPADFRTIHAYSPYHNIRDGVKYPPTLVITADHDDRVVPSHSFKFAARLQEAHQGSNPVLIRIATRAGHGSGKPVSMRIEEAADQLAFLTHHLK